MGSIETLAFGIIANHAIAALATADANYDWAAFTAKVNAAVAGGVHSSFLSAGITAGADAIITAVAKMGKDQTDVSAVVTAAVGGDLAGAGTALKALLAPVVSGDAAKLLAAAA